MITATLDMAIVIGALVSGLLLLTGTVLTVRATRLNARDTFVVAQLEMVHKDREWLYRTTVENREAIKRLQERERIRDDYIVLLRQHIEDEKPPPPPPYPIGLTNA